MIIIASMKETAWDKKSGQWYNALVGQEGHYYHQNIILPKVIKLLDLKKDSTLLDLACGQGILARSIHENILYEGIDLSESLIKAAKIQTKRANCHFQVADICKPFDTKIKNFTHATLILAVQNIEYADQAFIQASNHLQDQGQFIIVMNHPCFRIPRQSHWGVDPLQKQQFRRIDRYMSPLKIPIQTHPGKKEENESTWSFHHPLSTYIQWLNNAGFVIKSMEEWCSDKESKGKSAKAENRARAEFPLFLTIVCEKISSHKNHKKQTHHNHE